jgi:hypothetical protein
MAKMTLMEAIARSTGNKAKTTMHEGTDEQFTLIVQELGVMEFRWWVIEKSGHVWENKRDREECMEHLLYNGANPDDKIWLPAESDDEAIDPEELLSAIQTAVYTLGNEGGNIAHSDHLLREEAQKTLDHLQGVLKMYRREISK